MEHKMKVALTEDDRTIIIRALNDLRTGLLAEERPTDAVDELMIRIYEGRNGRYRFSEQDELAEYR